ncbi:MAG: hypothetical protein ACI8PB_001563 [Desulforhopalus sp.]
MLLHFKTVNVLIVLSSQKKNNGFKNIRIDRNSKWKLSDRSSVFTDKDFIDFTCAAVEADYPVRAKPSSVAKVLQSLVN